MTGLFAAATLSMPVPYPDGCVVAVMATRADVRRAAAAMAKAGVPAHEIEIHEPGADPDRVQPNNRVMLVIRQPGRHQLEQIRRVLRAASVIRARRYQGARIEEIVRPAGEWPTA